MGDEERDGDFSDGPAGRPPDQDDHQSKLLRDQKLYEALAAQGFNGSGYDKFANTIARHGLRIMTGWIRSGVIFDQVRQRNSALTSLHPHATWSSEDQNDIAVDTVAGALRRFRRHALIEGRWSVDGGATLETYFIGMCIAEFPNAFRGWRRRHAREIEHSESPHEGPTREVFAAPVPGPEDEVIAVDELARRIAELPKRQGIAVKLEAEGFTKSEIARILKVSDQAAAALLQRGRHGLVRRKGV